MRERPPSCGLFFVLCTRKDEWICKVAADHASIFRKQTRMKFHKRHLAIAAVLICSLFHLTASAQQTASENSADFSLAAGSSQGTVSAALVHNWLLGKNKRIIVGLGGRFTGYVGRNQYYVTAPATLTSGGTGPFVIFKENIVANMDSFLIAKPNVFAVNAEINLGYRFTEKWTAGFNIDAVGFSFGGKRNGNYINGPSGSMTSARPTSFNALLVSDNDLGTLNSELYAKYQFNTRLSFRGGFQFLFTEYTTQNKIQQLPEPNDRFRRKSLMLAIGISLKLN